MPSRTAIRQRATLLGATISPAPVSEAEKPALETPAESTVEAVTLLDDVLIALLDLPGDAWPDLVCALPEELYDRIDRYLEASLSGRRLTWEVLAETPHAFICPRPLPLRKRPV
jgi:hypothetical protein